MIKNILAVRTDRFGEFLLNIPAFRALKNSYPNSRLALAVHPKVAELARQIDFVDEVLVWDNKKLSFFQVFEFAGKLKKENFDLCVIFNPSKEVNLISFLAGIPDRVGYKRKMAILLTRTLKDQKYLGLKHEVEYNLELARFAGADSDDKTLSLTINDDIIKNSLSGLGLNNCEGAVVIHPWTSDAVKQWPISYFKELARRVIKECGGKVVLVGHLRESFEGQEPFGESGQNLIDLTGKTDLLQLAYLLKKSKLLVSGDSGPVHLASCFDIPVVAIFRNDLPGKNAKRWGPVSKGSFVVENSNLSALAVGEVFDKVKLILNEINPKIKM